jgi:DNA-binding NarL/FixJ family response regulator
MRASADAGVRSGQEETMSEQQSAGRGHGRQRPVILVVVASAPLRAAILQCLRALEPACEYLQAASGEEAVGIARARLPSVVLLDSQLPGMRCEQASAALTAIDPSIRVWLLAEPWQRNALAMDPPAGASGALCKDHLFDELGGLLGQLLSISSHPASSASGPA